MSKTRSVSRPPSKNGHRHNATLAWVLLAWLAPIAATGAGIDRGVSGFRLPIAFEPNVGQAPPGVRHLARTASATVLVGDGELRFLLPGADPVRLRWLGARTEPAIEALDTQAAKVNYFMGSNPARWRTDVPTYGRLRMRDLYPGVDLVLYGNEGQLEYDLVLAPGVDPATLELAVEADAPATGRPALFIDEEGNLHIATPTDEIVQRAANVYQEIEGARLGVASRYELRGKGRVGFCVDGYDTAAPLVIDPTIVYSTYLGGSGTEFLSRVVVDDSGNVIVAGTTTSTNLPVVNASDGSANGQTDLVLAKYTPDGLLSYLTYIGGSGDEPVAYGCFMTFDLAVDGSGNVVVAGSTTSSNYPTANAFDSTNGGGYDLFVTKLNTLGQIVFSTYLGGESYECKPRLAVDGSGNVLVTGFTNSGTGFPTVNAFDTNFASWETFVTKFNPTGGIVYSTAVGGSSTEDSPVITVDGTGNAFLAGMTASGDFPVASGYDSTFNGGAYDVFVAKLSPSGSRLWATFLGGNDWDNADRITLDGSGNAFVTGLTTSIDFPTANAYDSTFNGDRDAFVTKLNPSGGLVFSTYLGGNGYDYGNAVKSDGSGNAIVLGSTTSTNFPTVSAFDTVGEGGNSADFTVTKFSPAGGVVYSTYLGGGTSEYMDWLTDVAVDGAGNAIVAGYTYSNDFPLANPVDSTFGGTFEAFVTSLNPAGGANYSTFLGGSGDEFSTVTGRAAISIAVDPSGNAIVVGYTSSTDFPVANPADSTANGDWDFFVTKISGTGGCALGCSATVPTTGRTGQGVQFDSSATPSNCTGTPTVDWDFGDGSQHSGTAAPLHTYAGAGTYTWTLTVTVSGVTCSRTGTITVSPASTCAITCSATVPATAQVGIPFTVQASSTATGCTGTPSYWWQFGETTARIPGQNLTYVYQTAGSWPWNMAVEIGTDSCAKYGTIVVSVAPAHRYIVPSVAHAPGAGGTQWRTDVAAVNRSGSTASLTLTYVDDAQTLVRTASLTNGGTTEWRDILVSLFGLSATASNKGTLLVGSNVALAVTSRTYNQATAGTYGQRYPALTATDSLAAGKVGIIAQIKKNASFRTNLGIVNLGQSACTVAVKLWNATGTQVGATKQLVAQAGRWLQQDDIFGAAAAGSQDLAYATVEVQTAGGSIWAYASVVDSATGDPTTIPILVP